MRVFRHWILVANINFLLFWTRWRHKDWAARLWNPEIIFGGHNYFYNKSCFSLNSYWDRLFWAFGMYASKHYLSWWTSRAQVLSEVLRSDLVEAAAPAKVSSMDQQNSDLVFSYEEIWVNSILANWKPHIVACCDQVLSGTRTLTNRVTRLPLFEDIADVGDLRWFLNVI